MSRWFRHYAGMMRDDKLVRVAIRSKQTVERVVWVWGAILESAAEIDEDGRYDFDTAEAAYFLRADEGDLVAILDALSEQGRISQDRVVKWGDRQFTSDRSADRQRRYRERKKAVSHGDNGAEPVTGGEGDGGVTSLSRHGDAPETETETEDKSPNGDSPSDDGPALRPEYVFEGYQALAGELGLSIPRDFTPERRQLVRGRVKQYPLDDFLTVFGKCRDSPFLRGDRDGRTPLTFDWLMKKANFQKVLEGNYDR